MKGYIFMSTIKYTVVALLCAQVCQAGVPMIVPAAASLAQAVGPAKIILNQDVLDAKEKLAAYKAAQQAAFQAKLHANYDAKQYNSATALMVLPKVVIDGSTATKLLKAEQDEAARLLQFAHIEQTQAEQASSRTTTSNFGWFVKFARAFGFGTVVVGSGTYAAYEAMQPVATISNEQVAEVTATIVTQPVAFVTTLNVTTDNQVDLTASSTTHEESVQIQSKADDENQILLVANDVAVVDPITSVVENGTITSFAAQPVVQVQPAEPVAPATSSSVENIALAPSKTSAVFSSIVAHPYVAATAAVATIAAFVAALWHGQLPVVQTEEEKAQEEIAGDAQLALRNIKN